MLPTSDDDPTLIPTPTENGGSYDFASVVWTDYQVLDDDEREKTFLTSLDIYRGHYTLVVAISTSLAYGFLMKVMFNACVKTDSQGDRVGYDRWAILDVFSAIATLTIFPLMANSPVDVFLDKADYLSKDTLDYIVCLLIVLQFARFYSFMLMVPMMAKMLLTIKAMLIDTVPFMLLTLMFLFIMAAIFATAYGDTAPSKYGDFLDTFVTIFDNLMASYSYTGFGDDEISHMALLIFTVYFTNILFLNYLVAILSESYSTMLESGEFFRKVLLYQYCERYMIAFKNECYGEIIKHPAPACLLNLPLVIICLVPKLDPKFLEDCNILFSKTMFWLENIFWIAVFFVFEIALTPIVYLVNFYTIIWSTSGTFLPMIYCGMWVVSGPFFCIFIVFRDIGFFTSILAMHDGCKSY